MTVITILLCKAIIHLINHVCACMYVLHMQYYMLLYGGNILHPGINFRVFSGACIRST